jgi:hypothetical protein
MRIFKTDRFARFSKDEGIGDDVLVQAVKSIESGLVDADLGAGVLKVRIARAGAGKSGGYRTLIFFKHETRAIFAFGFAKKDMDNIARKDLAILKNTSKIFLSKSESEIDELVANGKLWEFG